MNPTGPSTFAEELSSLVDGEVDAATAARLSAQWRSDAEVRARWHRYQLIGDVMRSSELAGCGHDAAFLASLRARLAREPVVLAPVAPPQAPREVDLAASAVGGAPRRLRPASALRRWTPPAALAAGVLVVAIGSASLMRLGQPVEGPVLAQTPVAAPLAAGADPGSAAPGLQRVSGGAQFSASAAPEQATGPMIRDARLDGYLAAHKQFGGAPAVGLPSGFLRNATHGSDDGAGLPGARP